MISKLARRISVRLSAGFAGRRPFFSSFERMKKSMGLFGQLVSLTSGIAGFLTL